MSGDSVSTFQFLGLTFNTTNIISGLLAAIVVFVVVYVLSRKLQLKPTGKQNVLEWMIDFTNNIVRGSVTNGDAPKFGLYAFTLFLFIFVSNQLGMFLQIGWNGVTYVRSPTSDPVITLTLSLMTLMFAHYSGVQKFGFKGYFKHVYLTPFVFWLPISVFTELIDFLTLGLRIYGVIFSGEMLLKIIGGMAFSGGPLMTIAAVPISLIWQGFSVFLGSIQAYVFVTLTSVYISQQVQIEE
ncbi:F0F1 ATP synthase subunit A [Pediococcus inopinatus]|uniref:F0F1 ATP synthase subunit A n=1 Tax=Pediococcus inopinatus TaxID=114090 RepID=UPI00070F1B21|nr:F0F1 ATP synthase subunit A [Pediococcus inopinatus]AVL00310.1 F0F1 ATP synthase subunit A [Pediococcus inopinatus]KRN63370.1 F0F1-type ATP synthase, subunit a [Pediococcus inopinatus]WPC17972.1 F0F1 ATP synthase subunit A [Pediococcus inopinatus]WPP09851.1 F0F1 ATP synthase subunit A [Pediococcus inopinatus]